jgi:large subunit ribosomal protein L23
MEIVIYPRLTDKTYANATSGNTYVFNVPLSANKIQVKEVVEQLYSVSVETVNIVRMIGKSKRTVRKGGRQLLGKRSNYKKAYVTVKKGQTIPVFAATEEETK